MKFNQWHSLHIPQEAQLPVPVLTVQFLRFGSVFVTKYTQHFYPFLAFILDLMTFNMGKFTQVGIERE